MNDYIYEGQELLIPKSGYSYYFTKSGDNLNDIDMLESSGIGAAIGSSSDEVKNVASYVTLNSAENGGFAEAIYKFISFE